MRDECIRITKYSWCNCNNYFFTFLTLYSSSSWPFFTRLAFLWPCPYHSRICKNFFFLWRLWPMKKVDNRLFFILYHSGEFICCTYDDFFLRGLKIPGMRTAAGSIWLKIVATFFLHVFSSSTFKWPFNTKNWMH